MTSPLSLLSLLAPAPADGAAAAGDADAQAQDPAAFATALLAALAVVKPPPAPVQVVGAEPEDAPPAEEGQGAREEDQGSLASLGMTDSVDALGMTDSVDALGMTEAVDGLGMTESADALGMTKAPEAPGIAEYDDALVSAPPGRARGMSRPEAPAMVPVDATAVELPETSYVDPGALVPVTDGVVNEPLTQDLRAAVPGQDGNRTDSAATTTAGAADPRRPGKVPEKILREMEPFTGTVPVERHLPKQATFERARPQVTPVELPAPVPAAEVGPTTAPETAAPEAGGIIEVVAQAVESALPRERTAEPARPKREKAAAREPSAPADNRAEPADAAAPPAAPPALLGVMQAVIELARPVIAPRPQGGAGGEAPKQEQPRQPAPEVTTQPNAAPTEGLEAWSMAGNARLATQIAELMDGLNVTEFRVELGRRSAGPAKAAVTPAEATPAGDAAAPAMPLPRVPQAGTGADAAPALPPIFQRTSQPKADARPQTTISPDKPLMPGSELLGATIINRPAEKAAPAPGRDVALTTSQVLDDDLVETPAPRHPALLVPRAARPAAPAAPSLPADRQDLPSAEPAARSASASEPERPAARRERPSDSAAQGSGAMPASAERSATRGDEPATRGVREARNLPQAEGDAARPAGSADRVTLQVSDADGRATRIRVSVIGDQVRAVITPPDAESARQLEHRMDELQSALARQGFTASSVSVQAAELRSAADAFAGAGLGVSSSDARMTPGRDEPAGDQRQGRGQRDQQSAGGQQERQQQGRSRDQGAQQRRR